MSLITSRDFSELKRFELNVNQLKILFSLQYVITKEDVERTKGHKRFVKRQWLLSWSASIHDYLDALNSSHTRQFYNLNEIKQAINKELADMPTNKTWYPIAILEATLFIPYTELRRNKADDREYRKLRFTKQTKYIKKIVGERGLVKSEDIDQFERIYKKVIFQLRGIGPITVAIFGSGFPSLKEAALTSASLAAAGSGVILVDKVGIVGGGGLLSLTVSEADVSAMNRLIILSPGFTLLQAARLEAVVREIILNKQKNTLLAQHILEDYAEQIKKLNKYIQGLGLTSQDREDKRAIRELEESLKYMQRTYININTFTSCFNIGMEN